MDALRNAVGLREKAPTGRDTLEDCGSLLMVLKSGQDRPQHSNSSMKKFLSRLYQKFFPSAIKVQTMEKNLSDLTGKALESSLLMLQISSSFNHVSGAMNDLLTRNAGLIHKFDSQADSELLYRNCLEWCQQWFPESYKSFMDVPKQKGLH